MTEHAGTPRVSTIMPAYNREKYIAESIESVLKQSFTDFELIIVDDGSTDQTLEIARRYATDPRVHIIENKQNQGISSTRNRALSLARAEYIAPLDSDDIWIDPDKLHKQIDFLDSHPDHALVGGHIRRIDTDGKFLKDVRFPLADADIRQIMLRYNPFAQSALMFRKKAAMDCGGYDPYYKVCEDYALWLNMGKRHKLANIDAIVTGYRMHVGNITRSKRLMAADKVLQLVTKHATDYPNARISKAKAYLRLLVAYLRT